MDAEIGVRNLADSFRYNYLPRIAKALGHVKSIEELDDLPNHERLALLVQVLNLSSYVYLLIAVSLVNGTNRAHLCSLLFIQNRSRRYVGYS